VGELRDGERLEAQSLAPDLGALVGEQALQRHPPPQRLVERLVDLPHPPAAEEPHEPISTDLSVLHSPR